MHDLTNNIYRQHQASSRPRRFSYFSQYSINHSTLKTQKSLNNKSQS